MVDMRGMNYHASASAVSSYGNFGDGGALAKREFLEERCPSGLLSCSAIRESGVNVKDGAHSLHSSVLGNGSLVWTAVKID